MDVEKLLNQILKKYGKDAADSRTIQVLLERVQAGRATYPDAQKFAIETGKILTDAFREYLPEALQDGYLFRELADVLVRVPMETAGRDVAQVATAVQNTLNESAGIGIRAIVPDINQDQIEGIITGIVNTPMVNGEELFLDQVASFFEGYVDDFVHDNAQFQSDAGLSPTIQRIAYAKCCEWCSQLAGTYPYTHVSDRGNDVWRRHNNCHCQIIYNPAGSKRRK